MSDTDDNTDHVPAAALPPRRASDPWPHEHGEHPSGISVPDGGRPAHEHTATLIGSPVPVRRARRTLPLVVVAVVLLAVATAAAVIVMTV